MELIKPKKLEKGNTIAIISPSSGLAALFPHRLDNAIKFFKSEGYKVKEFNCTRKVNGWESAPAEERAKDIMDAFFDKEVKAIICTIGGDNANKVLEFLDFNAIKQNPKVFCGYSDISVLHYAIHKKSELITFYGPCVMTQFGEFPKPLDYTYEYFRKAVCSDSPIGPIIASKEWTDEVLDWDKKADLKRPRKLIKNEGYQWLKSGEANAEIIGGCLFSIINVIGTGYWPEHRNKILFLELPEGAEIDKGKSLAEVDSALAHLRLAGIFKEISGLIFGRPFRYNEKENEILKKVIINNTRDYNFPILYAADIGHTDPQITIPLGEKVLLNSKNNEFIIL